MFSASGGRALTFRHRILRPKTINRICTMHFDHQPLYTISRKWVKTRLNTVERVRSFRVNEYGRHAKAPSIEKRRGHSKRATGAQADEEL